MFKWSHKEFVYSILLIYHFALSTRSPRLKKLFCSLAILLFIPFFIINNWQINAALFDSIYAVYFASSEASMHTQTKSSTSICIRKDEKMFRVKWEFNYFKHLWKLHAEVRENIIFTWNFYARIMQCHYSLLCWASSSLIAIPFLK